MNTTPVKKRSPILEVLFWLSVLGNVLTIWSSFQQSSAMKIAQALSGTPAWLPTGRAVISVFFLLSLYGIGTWKKWGLYGYLLCLIASVVLTILGNGMSSPLFFLFSLAVNYVMYRLLIKPILSSFE